MSDPVSMLSADVEAELEAAFLEAVEAIAANVDVPSLIVAAERGDDDTVTAYVADRLRPAQDILTRAFTQAGVLAAGRLGLNFDPIDQTAVAARAFAVTAFMGGLVADTARAMIQAANRVALFLPASVVATSLLLGSAPTQATEKAILVREAIGLTPTQAANLVVFRAALERAQLAQLKAPARIGFTREAPPVPELPAHVLRYLSAPQRSTIEKAAGGTLDRATIDALVARQRQALIKVRAGAVATSGAVSITNAGEHASWQQAVQRRDLGPDWRRFWRDAGDEKVRHAHREVSAMNPAGVGIDEPFATPLGPCLHPPLEINCRCRVELRRMAA